MNHSQSSTGLPRKNTKTEFPAHESIYGLEHGSQKTTSKAELQVIKGINENIARNVNQSKHFLKKIKEEETQAVATR